MIDLESRVSSIESFLGFLCLAFVVLLLVCKWKPAIVWWLIDAILGQRT